MKIVCLMENTVGNESCKSEHGLSLYIEMEKNTILVDTGASGLFLENAENLDIDLKKVETVFLSHGHYDHGGGILDFHKVNPTAEIVMQKSALGDYWHKSESVEKYIGLDYKIKEMENLILLDGNYKYYKKNRNCNTNSRLSYENQEEKGKDYISNKKDNIEIFILRITSKEELKCWPKGNLVLKERKDNQYIQDSFIHEQYLILEENEKSVLISGCAHNGILNILEEYHNRYEAYPDVVVSGFHMRKKEGYTEEDYEVIRETARRLKETGTLCYTGHCTGEEPYKLMKEIMEEKLEYLHCGDKIEIY